MDMNLALIMVTCANVEVGDIGKGGWAQVLVSGKSLGTTRSDGVDAQCICWKGDTIREFETWWRTVPDHLSLVGST